LLFHCFHLVLTFESIKELGGASKCATYNPKSWKEHGTCGGIELSGANAILANAKLQRPSDDDDGNFD